MINQEQQQQQQSQQQQAPVTQPMNQVIAAPPQQQQAPVTQPMNQVIAAPPQPPQQAAMQNEQNTPDAYQTIIAQQQAQIDVLIAQTNAQSEQITRMVQGGAQFQQVQQPQQQFIPQQQAPQQVDFPNVYQPSNDGAHPLATFNPPSLASDEDYSLESLASEIGKRGE